MKKQIKSTIKSLPKDERPREKLIKNGVSSLSNIELLAIMLRTGYKDFSALDLSSQVLASIKENISILGDISVEELTKIKGIGNTKALQVIAAIELGRRISYTKEEKVKINSSTDISSYLIKKFGDLKREHFNVVMLDSKNYIIEIHNISIGNLNSSIVHPREVFKAAIRRSSASIILMHNHPSGVVAPSNDDILVTKRLIECGKLLGVEVLDHIIVGNDKYYSFKEEDIFN